VFVSHGYRPTAYRAGYERGYAEGLREGAHDGKRREVFSYWDEKRYVRCGWNARYGPRRHYEAGYRSGFEGGYRQAYVAYYRCERHGRVGCSDRRCHSYRSRYSHADDDWAYRHDHGDQDYDGDRAYKDWYRDDER
jgi:hypothetical protein